MGWFALPLLPGGLNGAAYAISADGNIPVGYVQDPAGDSGDHVACYWTGTSGPTVIGTDFSEAYGVSSDGSVIVGNTSNQPFVWTASGGLVLFAAVNDTVWGISADGSTIIGMTPAGSYQQACFWNRAGTRTDLGFLPGHSTSRTRGVSADGAFIVGESSVAGSGNWRAFLWSASGGMIDLGLVGAGTSARAYGVSNDGALVAGDLAAPSNSPFQWTETGGMTQLPMGVGAVASASCVSGVGGVIGGYADYLDPTTGDRLGGQYFAYWVASSLTVPPPVQLDPSDPNLSDTSNQTYPTGVDGDGKAFVGYTFGPAPRPWLYVITAPTSSLALDNIVAIDAAPVTTAGSQIFLDWSDDRGHTFGSPVGQPIGAKGAYLTSVQWQRLGYARDRVFRLTWSVPVATALQGAFIEVDTNPKS